MGKNLNQANCADCGVSFELPFTPTSDKPVFCNDCFRNKRKPNRDDRRDRHDRRDNRNRDREMFSAVCDKCGQKCEVPFRPSGGKPIFCNNCFSSEGGRDRGRDRGNNKRNQGPDRIQELTKKLDILIESLVAAKVIKLPKEPKKVIETPKEKPAPAKKETPKKEAALKKKPATKKKVAPKKKVTAKKKPAAKKKDAPKKKK